MVTATKKKRRAKLVPEGATRLTPPQAAERLQMSADTVRTLIETGEIRAINVARKGAKRPRYRVSIDDLEAFELRRTVSPADSPRPAPRPVRRDTSGVTNYV